MVVFVLVVVGVVLVDDDVVVIVDPRNLSLKFSQNYLSKKQNIVADAKRGGWGLIKVKK